MAGPALALQYLIIAGFFASLLFLLIFTIIKRHSLKQSVPSAVLFILLASVTIYHYSSFKSRKKRTAEKFLGDYKLNRLDRKECDSCIVRLYDGYSYKIFEKGKMVGQGKWRIETAIDIPGYYLKVENGPNWVVWEEDRLIEYIDRDRYK